MKKLIVLIITGFIMVYSLQTMLSPIKKTHAEESMTQNKIVITEIMATAVSNLEWVEIQNMGEESVNLENWKFFENNTNHGLTVFQGGFALKSNEIAIIANKADILKEAYPSLENTIFDSTWTTLNENGEEIGLKNSNGDFSELFTYISNTDGSLQRIDNLKNDYSSENWINASGTLGKENLMSDLILEDLGNEIQATADVDIIDTEKQATADVKIKNDVIEPTQISKPTAIITIQSGVTEAIGKVTLNLDGSFSTDPNGQKLTYFWDFGDKYIYESKNPPSHSFKEIGNYIVTLRVTNESGVFDETNITIRVLAEEVQTNNTIINKDEPSSKTIKKIEEETTKEDDDQTVEPNNDTEVEKVSSYPALLLNEIFPNPVGRDDGQEWVEIYNPNEFIVNTKGYTLDDYSDKGSPAMKLKEIEILPKSYYLIYDPTISLNNSDEEIQLIDPNGTLLDKIFFGKSFEGQSYARMKNEWLWSTFPTPNYENEIISEDLEIAEKKDQESKYKNGDLSSEIYINEILPNPLGEDAPNEWIELYNAGNNSINLGNWQLDDNENGSKPFVISDETIIKPKSYLLIPRTDSKISLDNRMDSVRLFNYEEEIQDEIDYEKAKENLSFAKTTIIYEDKIETEWIWTPTITPGSANQKLYKLRGEIQEKNADLILIRAKSLKLQEDNELTAMALSPGNLVELTYDDHNEIKDYSLIKEKPRTSNQNQTNRTSEVIKIVITLTIISAYILFKRKNKHKIT